MTANQESCIASTITNSLWIDIENGREVDLDELYDISNIRVIVNDPEDKVFYFLSNMKSGKVGFFLIKINESNPNQH